MPHLSWPEEICSKVNYCFDDKGDKEDESRSCSVQDVHGDEAADYSEEGDTPYDLEVQNLVDDTEANQKPNGVDTSLDWYAETTRFQLHFAIFYFD